MAYKAYKSTEHSYSAHTGADRWTGLTALRVKTRPAEIRFLPIAGAYISTPVLCGIDIAVLHPQ